MQLVYDLAYVQISNCTLLLLLIFPFLQTKCFPFDCPDTVGLDLAEPTCLEWDIDPNFTPQPPE